MISSQSPGNARLKQGSKSDDMGSLLIRTANQPLPWTPRQNSLANLLAPVAFEARFYAVIS